MKKIRSEGGNEDRREDRHSRIPLARGDGRFFYDRVHTPSPVDVIGRMQLRVDANSTILVAACWRRRRAERTGRQHAVSRVDAGPPGV